MSTPPDIRRIDTERDASAVAAELAALARHEILLLTTVLEPSLYATAQFVDSVRALLTSRPRASLRILVRDVDTVAALGHPLLDLAQRLPSKASARVVSKDFEDEPERLCIVDRSAYLRLPLADSWSGRSAKFATGETARHARFFEQVWAHATDSVKLRRLAL